MKRSTIVSSALCLALLTTGCVSGKKAPATEPQASSSAAVTTEASTEEQASPEAESTKAAKSEVSTGSHKVAVEKITLFSHVEGPYEFTTIVPKITVDGKEAAEINESLKEHIKKNYELELDGEYANGMTTRIAWGAKDNILSIIIIASDTSTDYSTREVFNYDLDTLKSLKGSEVTKCLGMTDEEFFSKTSDIIKRLCKEDRGYNLEKSLAAVKYDKITPFVMPDGNTGVLACVIYSSETQFDGLESMRCFDMKTMEQASLR